jgi:hypothetical protein
MHGGAREGSGRRSTWASGAKKEDSKLIRVPGYIADEVLKAAHRIDAGGKINYDEDEKVDQIEIDNVNLIKIKKIAKLVRSYEVQQRGTRDWTKANKILVELRKLLKE